MKKDEFANHNEAFKRRNPDLFQIDRSGAAAIVEPDSGHAPLAKKKVQGSTGKRFLVRITSVRKRLLDESNLCEKYHEDLCRYAGILPSDAPDQCHTEVSQRKVDPGEAEHVVIEITYPD